MRPASSGQAAADTDLLALRRLAILSGKVLLAAGFPAEPSALGLGARWPDAGEPYGAGRVSATLNSMLVARATTASATAIQVTARQSRPCPDSTRSDTGMS
jgi:hypothetical protein